MPDATLCGNGRACPKCDGSGLGRARVPALRLATRCGACRGSGRAGFTPAAIIAAQLVENAERERSEHA